MSKKINFTKIKNVSVHELQNWPKKLKYPKRPQNRSVIGKFKTTSKRNANGRTKKLLPFVIVMRNK